MNSEEKIRNKIYSARCIGNVEPIEYMIPYPSMRSLIEGQNIKYSKQVIIKKPFPLTNLDFYTLIQQTANWLKNKGLKEKERIIIPELKYPETEILLYGVWQVGATGVICKSKDIGKIQKKIKTTTFLDNDIDLINDIKKFPKRFNPTYKPLLDDEALITFEKRDGIKLSHYNLLVNTYAIQKALKIKSRTRYFCDIKPGSTIWTIFKVILPIFSGSIFDPEAPELTIGEHGCDFTLRSALINIEKYSKSDIAICPENTAAITIGNKPLHLTNFIKEDNKISLMGHSVTMGYLDNSLNKLRFNNSKLSLPI